VHGYSLRLMEGHCLEVDVEKGASLNDLFAKLSVAGVDVLSMRNKSNRLEELFVSLVNGAKAAQVDAHQEKQV